MSADGWVVSVDGGGTSTDVLLANTSLETAYLKSGEGTNPNVYGADGIDRAEKLIREVLYERDVAVENVEICVMGMAGISHPKHRPRLEEACEALLEEAIKTPKPLVIGTTGLNAHQLNLIKEASEIMPVLYATNMSLGVALLNKLVHQASAALEGFDIEIVEMHHRHKKDAPSGTALTLAESAAKGRNLNLDDVRVSGRDGNIGERSKDEIAVMALRGGDIVGRHTVGFYNDGEFIELNHTATSRNTFSKGALRAGKWLAEQKPGLYTISDCLEL